MACDRATTRQSDAADCRTDGFFGHIHVKSIGMDHARWAGDHCHVTLPEQQIAGLVHLIRDGIAKRMLLLIAITGASKIGGQQCNLDQARAVNSGPRVSAPQIGCVQKEPRGCNGILGRGGIIAKRGLGDMAEAGFDKIPAVRPCGETRAEGERGAIG